MIALTCMLLSLFVVFAIDLRQKRRRFLEESKQELTDLNTWHWEGPPIETTLLEAPRRVSLSQ